jgi:hypothetical protein
MVIEQVIRNADIVRIVQYAYVSKKYNNRLYIYSYHQRYVFLFSVPSLINFLLFILFSF